MSKKVLVVDDDKDIVFILQSTLKQNGHEVITASDGRQALKLLESHVPDLMIVDLTMPVVSGWHFTMKVRLDDRYKTTPIIILSGLLDQDVSSQKTENNVTYMPKPFDIHALMDKVKELLNAHNSS